MNFIKHFSGNSILLSTDCAADIELVTFRDEKEKVIRISAVCMNDGDVALKQQLFIIAYRTEQLVKSVKLLPDYVEIPFDYKDGIVSFTTRE